MKKMLIGMNILILVTLLSVTNSLYVEGSEIYIILCSAIIFSIVILSKKDIFFKIMGKAATIGFFSFSFLVVWIC